MSLGVICGVLETWGSHLMGSALLSSSCDPNGQLCSRRGEAAVSGLASGRWGVESSQGWGSVWKHQREGGECEFRGRGTHSGRARSLSPRFHALNQLSTHKSKAPCVPEGSGACGFCRSGWRGLAYRMMLLSRAGPEQQLGAGVSVGEGTVSSTWMAIRGRYRVQGGQ